MARPGRNIEQALLKSGRKLYAQRGAAGLAVRALTEHARVNLGMFHYHFRTKDEFLRRLLSAWYEEMFEQLTGHLGQDGPPLHRLQEALFFLARFVRDNRPMLARVLMDAATGNTVAAQFLRDNAPRHLALLLALMAQAEREKLIPPLPAGMMRNTPVRARFCCVSAIFSSEYGCPSRHATCRRIRA